MADTSSDHVILSFSPEHWAELLRLGHHDELSANLLKILRHFRVTSYETLDAQGQFFIDEFCKHFLKIFCHPAFELSKHHTFEFLSHNLLIANLVSLSNLRTTDAALTHLQISQRNLGKILTLYSARNKITFPHKVFFDIDPALASAWYGAYAEIYRSGLVNQDIGPKLEAHFNNPDPRLDIANLSLDCFFASTYVGHNCDRIIKRSINNAVQDLASKSRLRFNNKPERNRIAVFSGNWTPDHSVYRITSAYVKAFSDFHVTFFALGKRRDMDLSLFDEVIPMDFAADGTLDIRPLLENPFQVAFYPDVGLTPQSILLANLRIAPIQICALGHSVSTWGSQIDYVISGADVEPNDHPEQNYSECLVLLPGSGAVHNKPMYALISKKNTGAELIINCPWNGQKVNYTFCQTLRKLLVATEKALKLRLFVSASLNRQNDFLPFLRDLKSVLGTGAVEVYPGMRYQDYMALMEEGDLCIDSFPFGGCNTIADSLYLRKLTVTLEGSLWYNRIGSQMLRLVGLPELIAKSEDQYISIIRTLICDEVYRHSLQDRLNRVNLDETIFNTHDASYFHKAINYLIENHEHLMHEQSHAPIRIGERKE